MTIMHEKSTGNTITVNRAATRNLVKTRIPDTDRYNLTISPLTAKVYSVVLKKFKRNNFNPVSLRMKKSGDDITVTCDDAAGLPFARGDKWYSVAVAGTPCIGMSSGSLAEIAGMVAGYVQNEPYYRQRFYSC